MKRAFTALLTLILLLHLSACAPAPPSQEPHGASSAPASSEASAPDGLPDNVSPEVYELVQSIPKPEIRRPWGLYGLGEIPGLRELEGFKELLGWHSYPLFLDDQTLLVLTSDFSVQDYPNHFPKNSVLLLEYNLADPNLNIVYQTRVGPENGEGFASWIGLSRPDPSTLLATDHYSYLFKFSLPGYQRIDEQQYDDQGRTLVTGDQLDSSGYILVEPEPQSWFTRQQNYLEFAGERLEEVFAYVSPDGSALVEESDFRRLGREDFSPLLRICYADGRPPLELSLDAAVSSNEVSLYSGGSVHFAKDKPYFVMLLDRELQEPEGFAREMGSWHYWRETVLLVGNYETGELAFTPPVNGISSIGRLAFNEDETAVAFCMNEFSQYVLRYPQSDNPNLFSYTHVYYLDIEKFLASNSEKPFQ